MVQAEEGSGIPGTPEVYLTEEEATSAYKEAWAEALHVGQDRGEDTFTRADFDHEWETRDMFESDFWPEDGGVRMFLVDVDGLEFEMGDCAECGDPADAHLWHNDISHTYSQ